MKGRGIILTLVLIVFGSTQILGQDTESSATFDIWFFVYTLSALILFSSSIFKLTRPAPERLSEKMRCPNCGEEPFKVFKWTNRISIGKYVKGYMKCVSCNTELKRHYSKLTWSCLLLFSGSYLMIIIPILPSLLDPEKINFNQEVYLYLFMGVGVIGFLSLYNRSAFHYYNYAIC